LLLRLNNRHDCISWKTWFGPTTSGAAYAARPLLLNYTRDVCFLLHVALPVPLRTTFTYGVPEALRAQLQPGSRVLVPFRKKSMVGVVLELTDTPPEGATIRDVSKLIDLVPALTPKLLELGRWIAGYYLAPIGEVFRAMMPPVTELTARREIVLTEAGRALADKLQQGATLTDLGDDEAAFLQKLLEKKEHGRLVRRPSWEFRPRDCNACSGAAICKFRRRCRDASGRRNAWSRGKARARKQRRWRERRAAARAAANRTRPAAFTATPEACADVPRGD